MQQVSRQLHLEGKVIGLVPTMGFLHEGHLSLIKRSKKSSDITVVSVFVNPTQFGPKEDFGKYPRDIRRDRNLLQNAQVDYVFLPEADEIYPHNFQTYVNVENTTKILEGEFRPLHFRGVTTVVSILFNIVNPDKAYFGQKDAQQAFIIQQMTRDLKLTTRIVTAPIIREKDGLALSSRNVYLSEKERTDALVINHSLLYAKKEISKGTKDVSRLLRGMRRMINLVGSSDLDYVSVVDAMTFSPVKKLQHRKKYYILVACHIGKTRLIDNILIKN